LQKQKAKSSGATSTRFETDRYTSSTTPAFTKMFALSSRNPNAQPVSVPSATEKQAMGGAENKPGMFEQPNHLFQQMNDAKDGCVNTSPAGRASRYKTRTEAVG